MPAATCARATPRGDQRLGDLDVDDRVHDELLLPHGSLVLDLLARQLLRHGLLEEVAVAV